MAATDRLEDQTPDTANELYFAAALRHQVGVRRFSSGEVNRITSILEGADRQTVVILRRHLGSIVNKPFNVRSEQFRLMIKEIRELRTETLKELRQTTRANLLEFAQLEQDFEKRMLAAALPGFTGSKTVPADWQRLVDSIDETAYAEQVAAIDLQCAGIGMATATPKGK